MQLHYSFDHNFFIFIITINNIIFNIIIVIITIKTFIAITITTNAVISLQIIIIILKCLQSRKSLYNS